MECCPPFRVAGAGAGLAATALSAAIRPSCHGLRMSGNSGMAGKNFNPEMFLPAGDLAWPWRISRQGAAISALTVAWIGANIF
jgi:hypothetical protein